MDLNITLSAISNAIGEGSPDWRNLMNALGAAEYGPQAKRCEAWDAFEDLATEIMVRHNIDTSGHEDALANERALVGYAFA